MTYHRQLRSSEHEVWNPVIVQRPNCTLHSHVATESSWSQYTRLPQSLGTEVQLCPSRLSSQQRGRCFLIHVYLDSLSACGEAEGASQSLLVPSHLYMLPARLKVSGNCRFRATGQRLPSPCHCPQYCREDGILSQPVAVCMLKVFHCCLPSPKWPPPFLSLAADAIVGRTG